MRNDQLDEMLTDHEGAHNRRNFENKHRTMKYGFGITVLVMLTAAVTYLITKKMMELSIVNPACPRDVTGNLTLDNRTISFANNSDWKISSLNLMRQWPCSEVLCNPSFPEIILSLAASFVREVCLTSHSSLFLNTTLSQCIQFRNSMLTAYSKSGCEFGLNGTLFILADYLENKTTGNVAVNEMMLGIRQ